MAHGGDDNFEQQLKILERKFLCCYPLPELNIEHLPKSLNWQQQEQLLNYTYANILNQEYPIKVTYQLNFLKSLMAWLESNNSEVHDDIYEAYCKELQRSAQLQTDLYSYKHYILPAFNATIILRESNSFVAKGNTGLCSWQASLALTDYLLCNPAIVEQKTVLELGAGTGLCGIIVKKCLNADQFIMTDGSYECMQLMHTNLLTNFKTSAHLRPISAMLEWDRIREFSWEKYKQPHLVLAADVVYDASDFSALTSAIYFIFAKINSKIKMLLAATVRNEETLHKFKDRLEKLSFIFKERDVITPDKSHLFWDRSTQIKIFEIEQNTLKYEEMQSLCQSASELHIHTI